MEMNHDIMKEYAFILSKTKKKLFKKPKYEEASGDLSYLAQTLKNQLCPAYAGLMLHSKAKCEHEMRNFRKEIEVLKEAGELFLEAEKEIADIGCATLQTYLNYGVYCFNQAIKLQIELRDYHCCIWLSLRVARLLSKLSHYQDALRTLKSALNLLPENTTDLLILRDEIIRIEIVTRDYDDALKHAKFIRETAKHMPDNYTELFSKNELTYMLLVLVRRVKDGRYEKELKELVSDYHPDDVLSGSSITMVDNKLFFLMQGLLMAYLVEDWDNIEEIEPNFDYTLTPGQMQLFYTIHTKQRSVK